jgi:hypothetical protein
LCWMILLLGDCFSLSLSLQEILATLFLYMKISCHGFSLIYFEAFSSYGWWWWWWWWWFLHSLLNPSSLHLVWVLGTHEEVGMLNDTVWWTSYFVWLFLKILCLL